MSNPKHTPTPWRFTDDGRATTVRVDSEVPKPIAEIWDNGDSREANAAFIVRAVNNHDALVSALQQIIDRSHNDPLGTSKVIDMRKIAEAALALVEQHFQADARR